MLKLDWVITLQWPISVLSERKSHIFPTLNQKLEMIKLSEEGMLKVEMLKASFFLNLFIFYL